MKLSDLMKPTKVRTRKYGTLTLRRLSTKDSAFFLGLRKSDLSSSEVIGRVIHRQLESPTIDLDIIRAWDKRLLKRVARLLVEGEIKQELPAKELTLDGIVNALYNKLDKPVAELSQSISALRDALIVPGFDAKSNLAAYGIGTAAPTVLGEWDKFSASLFPLRQTMIGGLPQFLAKSALDQWDAVKGWAEPTVNQFLASGIIEKLPLSEASKTLEWITDISRMSPLLSAMESTLSFQRGVTAIDASPALRDTLIGSFIDMNASYNTFLRSLAEPSTNLVFAYPEVPRLSAWEVFNTGDLIEHVFLPDESSTDTEEKQETRDEISADIEASLPSLLSSLNKDLRTLWEGAKDAIASRNPDRVRHSMTSLRELFTQVLHLLSPDDEVRKWTTSPDHYDEKKRPTRRARVLYICRAINDGKFGSFVNKDVDVVMEVFNLFQAGTHSVTPPYTDAQLLAIAVKVDGALRFLLQISRAV